MINVGIIGAGRIGQVHAKSILSGVPQAHILAIADPYMKPAVAEWAKASGIENVYTDYKKILEDERIDAVLICASTNLHAQLSLEAIAAGKHIFCEKPIDQSVAKIEEVKAALAASPKKLIYQVGFNRRYDHNYRAMRDAVAAGKIGEVQYVRVSSRDPEPPPAEYAAVSGGIFMDMMIHDLDMVRYLSGQEVVELYAQGACLIDPAIGEAGDVDTATITLKLANGALATIDGSRKAVYGYDQRGEVFGSKGCVVSGEAPVVLPGAVHGLLSGGGQGVHRVHRQRHRALGGHRGWPRFHQARPGLQQVPQGEPSRARGRDVTRRQDFIKENHYG